MDKEQAYGRYLRLQRELMEAYTAPVCQNGLIERLTDELAAVRYEVTQAADDEQSSDTTVPGILSP